MVQRNLSISVVIPALNEEQGLSGLLPDLCERYPDAEIIVVDDGSSDATGALVRSHPNVKCVSHPVTIGNGGAVKTGARVATGDVIVFMDADGQHRAKDVERLLTRIEAGYDMVVGARSRSGQASPFRALANRAFNLVASYMTGFRVEDLTSGFRAVRREKFLTILYLLPNKFSYPTTSTMAFFRSGYFVAYEPITVLRRDGKSHVKLLRDGLRFMIIILKIGSLFSPMRLFLPISALLFGAASLYYGYTLTTAGRFTNMGMLLYMTSLSTFLIGIVSEQVSALHYKDTSRVPRHALEAGAPATVSAFPPSATAVTIHSDNVAPIKRTGT